MSTLSKRLRRVDDRRRPRAPDVVEDARIDAMRPGSKIVWVERAMIRARSASVELRPDAQGQQLHADLPPSTMTAEPVM